MSNIKENIIYNNNYLIILSKMSERLYDSFEYTFGNTIIMDNNLDNITKIKNLINNNNFQTLIFVDYQVENEEVINGLIKKHEIKLIFTKALGALSDEFIKYVFDSLYKMYENGTASEIAFLDKGLYDTFKNKGENIKYLKLDIEKKDNNNHFNKNVVGLLNVEYNPRHSFYNELSAIKLSNHYIAKLPKIPKRTKEFLKLFNIKSTIVSDDDLIANNELNLYINFTDNDYTVFFKSMDNNVPCILGNTSLLDNYKKLKELLVMSSDDDIDEIKDRMDMVSKNRDIILKEYKKFREEYSKDVSVLREDFIGKREEKKDNKNYEKFITIVVPVYNVEDYLSNTLDSIIDAIVDFVSTELLIVNDGSTDNSEEIIKKYQKNYPELIRYIKQENHGLGNVRNVGLKEAKGKYIASIDSDDTINRNFFSEAMPYLEDDIDIVLYDWKSIPESGEAYDTSAIEWSLNHKNKYEGILFSTIMPSTCNKIIKKSLYDELNIKFIEDRYEDLSTNPLVLLKAKTLKYINKPYYEYYLRSGSIMRSSAGYSMIDVIKELDQRVLSHKDIINVNLEEFKYYTYSWRIEEYVMNQLYTVDEKEMKEMIQYIDKNIKQLLLDIFHSQYYKEMVNGLKDEHKKYIEERNNAYQGGKLETFIKKYRKDNHYFKLTPAIIYYGDKSE